MALTKRFKAMAGQVEPGKPYPIDAALKILKDNAKTKFVESVDVAIRLGIDAKKSDQGVRGSTLLPHGTGKTVRVAVFCPAGKKAEAAKAAGADAVGMDELAQQMQGGDLDFGVVIATPDVVGAVKNAKAGQVRYRNDKAGIVHCSIGKVNFEIDALRDNLNALVADLIKVKPSTAKGQYLQKVSVSSTMGLGVIIDPSTLAATATK